MKRKQNRKIAVLLSKFWQVFFGPLKVRILHFLAPLAVKQPLADTGHPLVTDGEVL